MQFQASVTWLWVLCAVFVISSGQYGEDDEDGGEGGGEEIEEKAEIPINDSPRKMWSLGIAVGVLLTFTLASAVDVSSVKDLEKALNANEKTIVLKDINVPAGETLKMENLKSGTVIRFAGKVTFGYKEWVGPLVKITGTNIRVEGTPKSLLDGGGARWWDGKGGNGGKKKPKFIAFHLKDSKVSGLNFKNSPVHLASVNRCYNVEFSNIKLDNSEGHVKGGHNTDGFDVNNSDNVIIRGCRIENQDDCLAINSGRNITFENNVCIGGHGISIGSVGGRENNVVEKILVNKCTVINNTNGIRVKTIKDTTGLVKNVKFTNVELQNISKMGITIQGNYANSGARGEPTGGVPIQDLVIDNVYGTVNPSGININVLVANASKWSWKSNVTGGMKKGECKGIPAGLKTPCGK